MAEDNKDNDEYEKICYLCRRPESKAGKMITIPGEICLCADCMQKTFDTVKNMGIDTDFVNAKMPKNDSAADIIDKAIKSGAAANKANGDMKSGLSEADESDEDEEEKKPTTI